MKMQKQQKGEYGYPSYERKRVVIRTAAYFLISIAVFLLGYFSTGKRKSSHNRCCPRTAAIEQESGIGRHVLQDSKVQRKGLSGSLQTGRCGACAL